MFSKKKDNRSRTKTLIEQGPNLPLGILQNNSYQKTIEVKRWTMRQEKELGELREKESESKLGRYVSMILATMCPKLGPFNFDESYEFSKRLLNINQMWSGDVFYAYCWLRYKSLGEIIALKLNCLSCKKDFEFDADMRSMEINVGEKLEDFLWEYELREPFEIRGEVIKKLIMGPSLWNVYETMSNTDYGGLGDIKSKIIFNSIHALNKPENKIILSENEIEDLAKIDIELIAKKLDNERLGPDLSIEAKCPKCKYQFTSVIPWGFDSFFGNSSR
jgi:hypothetical protein